MTEPRERTIFADRAEAGRALAARLGPALGGRDDVLVLALPRGGVPVAAPIAEVLEAPLDVLLVRKLGVPGQEELAFGAIASGGIRVLNHAVIREAGIDDDTVASVSAREGAELQRRLRAYRGDRPTPELAGRRLVLVDDGLATGATMLAAVAAVREQEPARVVVAVPVAPAQTARALRERADELVCLLTREPFGGVGAWYHDFSQTTDGDVARLLDRAWARRAPAPAGASPREDRGGAGAEEET